MNEATVDPALVRLAKEAFNATWDLLDLPELSGEDARQALERALGSRYLWERSGAATDNERCIGDWLVGHVLCRIGQPAAAASWAQACADRVAEHRWEDFRLASSIEGLARVAAGLGDRAEFERLDAEARVALRSLSAEDRAVIAGQLDSIPRPG